MRKIAFLMFLLMSVSMISQELSMKEISKIRSLAIDVQKLNLQETYTQKNMRAILKLDRKRKVNKRWAIGFSVASALLVVGGLKAISDSKTVNPNINSHNFGEVLGGLVVASGFLPAIASIPFWVSTHKRKKERDKLLLKYQ